MCKIIITFLFLKCLINVLLCSRNDNVRREQSSKDKNIPQKTRSTVIMECVNNAKRKTFNVSAAKHSELMYDIKTNHSETNVIGRMTGKGTKHVLWKKRRFITIGKVPYISADKMTLESSKKPPKSRVAL